MMALIARHCHLWGIYLNWRWLYSPEHDRRKYSKMDKGAKDKLAGSPGENGGGQDAQRDLHSRTGGGKTKRKTQVRMERRSRKRSSGAGSEKMERVGDR
jgi:hypothetical protein